jgi:antitoxin ParD1/3/4
VTTSTMSISLPQSLKDYIGERVVGGRFSNPSDYIRSLVREDQKRQAEEKLEALLIEGLASGPADEATPEYWQELAAQARARIAARKPSRG